MPKKLTLREAAQNTVNAIESRKMHEIQEAGRDMKEVLARTPGRPGTVSDEEFRNFDHLSAIDAAEELGVTPDAVYKRRRKLKEKGE